MSDFSEYLNMEMEGLEDSGPQPVIDTHATDLGESPDLDLMLTGMAGSPEEPSLFLSPISGGPGFGSAPSPFHALEYQDSFVQSPVYNNPSSQSFPSVFNRMPNFPSVSSILARGEGEDHDWFGELLMRNDPSPAFLPPPSTSIISSSFSTVDTDINHFPNGWLSSNTSAVNRAESVLSLNSVESFATNNSFDDFHTNNAFAFVNQESDRFEVPPAHQEVETKVELAKDTQSVKHNEELQDASTPRPSPKPSKPGRKGKLTGEQKTHAAHIRRIGACKTCRMRRAKCDDGIPCSTCKKYFRTRPEMLEANPCRGESLKELSKLILHTNAFPKGPYGRFLSQHHSIEPSDMRIALNLGFGNVRFPCRISLVTKNGIGLDNSLIHKHVEYPWTSVPGSSVKHIRQSKVFPAILADNEELLLVQVERHLTKILIDKTQFQYFPVWFSELKVLRLFYKYFLSLPSRSRNPLKQAFQILMLVHVGGDLKLLHDDPVVARINDTVFPGLSHELISPCLIRAQLGVVFSKLAHRLMSEVLRSLERLSPVQDPAHFPMVIATFSVLFMALESLQYHFAKVAYHSDNDAPGQASVQASATRDLDDFEASDILLRFYQSTSCHERLGPLVDLPVHPDLSPKSRTRSRAGSASSARWSAACPAADNHGAREFLENLGEALREAAPYIAEKDQSSPVVPTGDMSCFFDRLLAKMYRLKVPATA